MLFVPLLSPLPVLIWTPPSPDPAATVEVGPEMTTCRFEGWVVSASSGVTGVGGMFSMRTASWLRSVEMIVGGCGASCGASALM